MSRCTRLSTLEATLAFNELRNTEDLKEKLVILLDVLLQSPPSTSDILVTFKYYQHPHYAGIVPMEISDVDWSGLDQSLSSRTTLVNVKFKWEPTIMVTEPVAPEVLAEMKLMKDRLPLLLRRGILSICGESLKLHRVRDSSLTSLNLNVAG